MKLPKPLRRGLYLRIGKGYEQAYAAAVEFLRGESDALS